MKKREDFARVSEQKVCVYGCACVRGANCKVLEGIHQVLVFPYCRRQGGRTLLKVQTDKPSSCVTSKGQGAEHPWFIFIASVVKVESLYQDFCAWFGATALSSPAQTVLSCDHVSDVQSP